MKTTLHRAGTRGHSKHGWLDSHHTFSFAGYYDPARIRFGTLRVLNDDVVAPGMGFGTHPHDNMEIISIPLAGDLEHSDSMGNKGVIKEGDIQVMSAGTGIHHSEYNANDDREVRFLQIWVFPNQRNVTPRYDQITLDRDAMKNRLAQILSPDPEDDGVWIHQRAWFHMGRFEIGTRIEYPLKDPANCVYLFLIEGSAEVEGINLGKRDGLGIEGADFISGSAGEDLYLLLMELPLKP